MELLLLCGPFSLAEAGRCQHAPLPRPTSGCGNPEVSAWILAQKMLRGRVEYGSNFCVVCAQLATVSTGVGLLFGCGRSRLEVDFSLLLV
jgi:hypothetical protein